MKLLIFKQYFLLLEALFYARCVGIFQVYHYTEFYLPSPSCSLLTIIKTKAKGNCWLTRYVYIVREVTL